MRPLLWFGMWHRLYYHLVWTTALRELLLDAECARLLSAFSRSVAAKYRARVLELGAVRTHVHVLITGHPKTNLPELVGHIKGGSATIWNKNYSAAAGWSLRWAAGYGISSISPRQVERVRQYLRAQPTHHPEERILDWDGDRPAQEFLR